MPKKNEETRVELRSGFQFAVFSIFTSISVLFHLACSESPYELGSVLVPQPDIVVPLVEQWIFPGGTKEIQYPKNHMLAQVQAQLEHNFTLQPMGVEVPENRFSYTAPPNAIDDVDIRLVGNVWKEQKPHKLIATQKMKIIRPKAWNDIVVVFSDEILNRTIDWSDESEFDPNLVRYELILGPEGMNVDSEGSIRWSFGVSNIGNHPVTVRITEISHPTNSFDFVFNVQVRLTNNPGGSRYLGLWVDEDDNGQGEVSEFRGILRPFLGTESAVDNYNYYSASAHPIVGPDPEGFAARIFFYLDKHGWNLNMINNIDNGGSADNIVHWDVLTWNNDQRDEVLLSDDSNELVLQSRDNGISYYRGRFHYWVNTDGGVIGPFSDDGDFKVRVRVLTSGDITQAAFYSGHGPVYNLATPRNVTSSFIIGPIETDGDIGIISSLWAKSVWQQLIGLELPGLLSHWMI